MDAGLRFSGISKITQGSAKKGTEADRYQYALQTAQGNGGEVLKAREFYQSLQQPVTTREDVVRLFLALQNPAAIQDVKIKIASIDKGDFYVLSGKDKGSRE